MARGLNRIWVRFGLWITASILGTIALLWAGTWVFSSISYNQFYNSLPREVKIELDELVRHDQEDSPRAMQIYSQY